MLNFQKIANFCFVVPKFNLFYFQEFLSDFDACTIKIFTMNSTFQKCKKIFITLSVCLLKSAKSPKKWFFRIETDKWATKSPKTDKLIFFSKKYQCHTLLRFRIKGFTPKLIFDDFRARLARGGCVLFIKNPKMFHSYRKRLLTSAAFDSPNWQYQP